MVLQGFRNICIDFTFFSNPTAGSSTISLTEHFPRKTVPVTTVPWPRIVKQWSTLKKKGPSTSRAGMAETRQISETRVSRPTLSTFSMRLSPVLPPTAATFSPPTAAAVHTIGASRNLEVESCSRIRFFVFSNCASRSASGMVSILLRTIIKLSVVISPMTRHSAVCVWMPLTASTIRSIMSMICAPPMIVRISEAWPGQSTSVSCSFSSS
mmetsp:Transcript_25800/g.86701  ORF Transcript_25800/g.86701 Transcript_25800/m.86701 type:complete len:211 (-) Transcript_25800:288-920(-)